MLLHIIIEIVLALVIFLAAQAIWQIRKREKFLKHVVCNPPFLESIITRERLANPPERISIFAQKNEVGHILNMKCVVDADRASQRHAAMVFTVIVVVILIGSYFLGVVYLLINLVFLCLAASVPISRSAQSSALEHVFTIALILHKWRLENPSECDQWIDYAKSLRPVYDAVKKAE